MDLRGRVKEGLVRMSESSHTLWATTEASHNQQRPNCVVCEHEDGREQHDRTEKLVARRLWRKVVRSTVNEGVHDVRTILWDV